MRLISVIYSLDIWLVIVILPCVFCWNKFGWPGTFDPFASENPMVQMTDVVHDLLTGKLSVRCPLGLVPYYVKKIPKLCRDSKEMESCTRMTGHKCYDDSMANVSVCCKKVEGCPYGAPQVNTTTNIAVRCLLNAPNRCDPPYECHEDRPGFRVTLGLCCPPIPPDAFTKSLTSDPSTTTRTPFAHDPCCPGPCCPFPVPGMVTTRVTTTSTSTTKTTSTSRITHLTVNDETTKSFSTLTTSSYQKTTSRKQQSSAETGCPWGTAPMKISNTIIICQNDQPDSCPENAKCYYDQADNTSKCCTSDQSDGGCPGGYKAMKTNNEYITCSPDPINFQACPNEAICHWNEASQHYHCCESDNGCPEKLIPVLNGQNEPLKCLNNSQCPESSSCEFDAARNQYQCCRNPKSHATSGPEFQCPNSEILSIDPQTLKINKCSINDTWCPGGAICRIVGSKEEAICCIPETGRCPKGYISLENTNYNISTSRTCDLDKNQHCTAPAVCLRAVDAVRPVFVCCLPTPQCPYSTQSAYIKSDDNPRMCSNTSEKMHCPDGYRCEQSTLPYVNICCSSSTNAPVAATAARTNMIPVSIGGVHNPMPLPLPNPMPLPGNPIPVPGPIPEDLKCPPSFEGQSNGMVICDPGITTSCNSASRCMPANKPGFFICCTPAQETAPMSNAKCTLDGVYIRARFEGPKLCNPGFIFTGCPQTHSLCLFFPPIGRHACCRAPICPNGQEPLWTLGTTVPRHCGAQEAEDCPGGYACLYSAVFEASICCLSGFRVKNMYSVGSRLGGELQLIQPPPWAARKIILPPWGDPIFPGDIALGRR